MYFLAKYNTQTDIEFAMVKRGVVDLAGTADWTPATGDTKIIKDGANATNTTNNPAAIAGTGSVAWKLTLTATELSAARVQIQIVDSATKAVEDQFITVYTFGNASAKFPFDFSDQVRAGLTALPNAAAEAAGGLFTRGTGAGQINQTANGMVDNNTVRWSGTAVATPNTAGVPVVDTRSVVRVSTAQGTGNSTTAIKLDASASATTGFYKGFRLVILSGTGAPESALITAYDGTTKIATLSPAMPTAPDGTSVFMIIVDAMADLETIGEAALNTSTAQIGANAVQHGGTAQTGRDIGASVLLSPGTGTGQVNLSSGAVPVTGDLTSTMKTSVESSVWDAARSSHVTATSFGALLQSPNAGTAQAGAAGTITLAAGASATDNLYQYDVVFIISGTGAGQARSITGYVGSTKVASIAPNWTTNPDNTSVYVLIPNVAVSLGTDAIAGSAVSAAAVQKFWDALTTALTTSGSVGKRIADNLDATVTSRASQTSLDAVDDYVDTEVAAIKAKTDNLPTDPADASDIAAAFTALTTKVEGTGIKKNTALTSFVFIMTDSTTGAGKTGLSSFTKQYSLDGGAFSSLSNSVTEIANGAYKIDLTSGELNGNLVILRFAATGANDTLLVIKTIP
jgi:hypothetical protein